MEEVIEAIAFLVCGIILCVPAALVIIRDLNEPLPKDEKWEPNPGVVQYPTERQFKELSRRLPCEESYLYFLTPKPTCERCGSTNVTRSRRVEKELFGKATKTIYTCKYCNYKKITSVPHSFWGSGRRG